MHGGSTILKNGGGHKHTIWAEIGGMCPLYPPIHTANSDSIDQFAIYTHEKWIYSNLYLNIRVHQYLMSICVEPHTFLFLENQHFLDPKNAII